MLVGRNFVGHIVMSTNGNLAPTIIRGNFRATAARTAAGEITVTLSDDTPEVDGVAMASASPDTGAAAGTPVGINVKRSAVNTWKIITNPALTADAPGVGFAAAPVDPGVGTTIQFSLDRVDTV